MNISKLVAVVAVLLIVATGFVKIYGVIKQSINFEYGAFVEIVGNGKIGSYVIEKDANNESIWKLRFKDAVIADLELARRESGKDLYKFTVTKIFQPTRIEVGRTIEISPTAELNTAICMGCASAGFKEFPVLWQGLRKD